MSNYTKLEGWCVNSEGILYTTTKEVKWDIGTLGSGFTLCVPVGTTFDLSVPWLLRWLVNPHDPRYLKAAVLHDYTLELDWHRVDAGAAFHGGLMAQGVNPLTRLVLTTLVTWWKWE